MGDSRDKGEYEKILAEHRGAWAWFDTKPRFLRVLIAVSLATVLTLPAVALTWAAGHRTGDAADWGAAAFAYSIAIAIALWVAWSPERLHKSIARTQASSVTYTPGGYKVPEDCTGTAAAEVEDRDEPKR